MSTPRYAVLVSGRGSNLAALLTAAAAGALPAPPALVLSNRAQAPALDLARAAQVPTCVLDHRAFEQRADFDRALADILEGAGAHWVVLAGFMRVLTQDFVTRYAARLVNIHPSLLPAFPGLDTHARALASGTPWHGASVHFVTEQVDGGPVIAQARVPVLRQDTPETLSARVLTAEHRLYPTVLDWLLRGRAQLRGAQVYLDGCSLDAPVQWEGADAAA